MNDQISRQKLIMAIANWQNTLMPGWSSANDTDTVIYNTLEEVVGLIESQPPADQWIPCSERLPKFLQPCFITVQYGGLVTTFRAVYWESHWSTENENFHLENVIAWMPAEPYKGVE